MRKGGGKQKGANYEREVCKRLSKWVSAGERDDLFWRSAMSGGRATIGFREGVERTTQSGDVSYIDSVGRALLDRFVVECKFYKDLQVENLIWGTSQSGIVSFWNQVYEDARATNKEPLLVAKQNHKPVLAATSYQGLLNMEEVCDGFFMHDIHDLGLDDMDHIDKKVLVKATCPFFGIIVFGFDELLDTRFIGNQV